MSNRSRAPKPSCNKVKNPCKFCLQQVTNKNGLQCQGACKKWAHFKCLNYTPGKISDIKAGFIKVTCPCPDCVTTQVKEFLINPPYKCSNHQCPANRPLKCELAECPSNAKKKSRQPQNMSVPVVDCSQCPNKECSNEAVDCPAAACPNLSQQRQRRSHPRMSPPRPPTPPCSTPKNKSPPDSPKRQIPKCCMNDKKGGKKKQPVRKSPSCSLLSSDNSRCPGAKTSSSDSNFSPRDQASMMQALQEMCGTVGKLSIQLKDLMCKMMQNV